MIKQVIILRKDLNMRKGKMIAQGAHASMAVLLDMFLKLETDDKYKFSLSLSKNNKKESDIAEWINGSFAKICVYVNSEEELLKLYKQAKENNLPCSLIQDAGRTEFHNIKTYTAVAIGPCKSKDVDLLTGNLKLL